MVVTKMLTMTDSHLPIAFYIMFAAAVSFVGITLVKIRYQHGLLYLV